MSSVKVIAWPSVGAPRAFAVRDRRRGFVVALPVIADADCAVCSGELALESAELWVTSKRTPRPVGWRWSSVDEYSTAFACAEAMAERSATSAHVH